MSTTFGQKFTTTKVSVGCKIKVRQDNPLSDGGVGTIPTSISIKLYGWDTDYSTTVNSDVLVYDIACVASEEIENDDMWIYLFWLPLPPGTYLWLLTVSFGDENGTFQVLRDTRSAYKDAYEDGVNVNYDFYSEIFIFNDYTESYEYVLSYGDTFVGSYTTDNGHSNPKINNNTVDVPNYVNSIHSQDPVIKDGRKVGRIATGSFVFINPTIPPSGLYPSDTLYPNNALYPRNE